MFQFIPKVFDGVEVWALCGQSSSSAPNSTIHVFIDLALCTGEQSCWNMEIRIHCTQMKCKMYFHLKRGLWSTGQQSSSFSPQPR